MLNFDHYIDSLISSCRSSIEQMTHIQVKGTDKRLVLKDQGMLPFAHIITYKDYENEFDGEFILGFESVNDALKLASAIAERLGIDKFDKENEDSTDLLNEFLNIVVGRTISEWDNNGLKVEFNTPVFKKRYKNKSSKHLQGYIITMDITSNTVDLEEDNPMDQLLFRVNFMKRIDNKLQNRKILIAEDSNVMRTIIAKILTEHGAKVKEARNGEEAVKLHKIYNPDLALMDINMPKLNGLEAIAQIKEFHPGAKFMILSSSSRKDEIISAKTLKVSGYIVKPVEPDTLIDRISAVL